MAKSCCPARPRRRSKPYQSSSTPRSNSDYSCFAYQIAQTSSQHTRTLFFDRDIKRVTELAWDQAVNDTANLWQSILWNALGPERTWQLYGISAPVKELRNGSLC